MTRKYGGTGLGLLLLRKLARSLGGDLRLLTTALDVGTSFLIEIPDKISTSLKGKTSKFLQKPDVKSLAWYRILLVGDSPDNQDLIRRYLTFAGANVECPNNGEEGVRAALDANYNVVLMDIQMPVMEGGQAIHELREKRYAKPILALTPHAMRGEREKSMKCGFSEYLT